MIIIKKDKQYNQWLVWDSKNKSEDLVNSFSTALRIWLWRIGVPAKMAFYKLKNKEK